VGEQWITIAEFFDLKAAHILRSRLEAEEIPVFLSNENVIGLNDPQFLGGPGAQLKVPAEEVEHAMEILREVREKTAEKGEPEDPLPATKGYRSGLRFLAVMTLLTTLIWWWLMRY
jgi:hypothetical protein